MRKIALLLAVVHICLFWSACVPNNRMSLEDARKVAVSIQKTPFTPPPRRLNDILAILHEPGRYDSEVVRKFKSILDSGPPDGDDVNEWIRHHSERGYAAQELGYPRAYEYLKKAMQLTRQAGLGPKKDLLFRLGREETLQGNFKTAVELLERAKIMHYSGAYIVLERIYAGIGDLENAKKIRDEGLWENSNVIARLEKMRKYDIADRRKANDGVFRYVYLEAQGKFSEAESFIRSVVRSWEKKKNKKYAPSVGIVNKIRLASNLMMQGRLLEAEHEARQVLLEAIGLSGKGSGWSCMAVNALARIIMAQGRLKDAENLVRAEIGILHKTGMPANSLTSNRARLLFAGILVAGSDFAGAMEQYDQLENSLENKYMYKKMSKNPDFLLSLIKTGRSNEALRYLADAYAETETMFGPGHYKSLELLGLRAMARARTGDRRQALDDFSKAVPRLLRRRSEHGIRRIREQRLKVIVEEYLDFLAEIYETQLAAHAGIDLVSKAFTLVDALGGRSVESALGASSARAAVEDQGLAELLRNEQDALKQKRILEDAAANLLAAPKEQQAPGIVQELQEEIRTVQKAHATLLDEIQQRFPKYGEFISPRTPSVKTVRAHLLPGETMIVIYPSGRHTYIWGVPSRGNVRFYKADIGAAELRRIVSDLRKALDPGQIDVVGDIPEYDLSLAHALYARLLKPIAPSWQEATDLIIVTPGPLGQLPFALLPTRPAVEPAKESVLFERYRKTPWLLRKVSLTRVPSVSSFVTLRSIPAGRPDRKPFIGFGDPFFNKRQFARARQERPLLASKGAAPLRVRGVRISEQGTLDSASSSIRLQNLNRLPGTSGELISIARALNADADRDLFLGENASEHKVKTADLSGRKIVAFATHALVPGDLDGLVQPALALSAPEVTGGQEDGLLTLAEIMNLKLDADWVVLSACNTGAGDGKSAEAVSGLGRAFFYAGTRALLVTMWPIETTAAKKLITGLFQYQNKEGTVSRSRALRRAALDLMDGPGMIDPGSGRIVASYAHPLFWAPFIVVGDNGRVGMAGQ